MEGSGGLLIERCSGSLINTNTDQAENPNTFAGGARSTDAHMKHFPRAQFCEIAGLEEPALKEFEKQIEFDWDDLELFLRTSARVPEVSSNARRLQ